MSHTCRECKRINPDEATYCYHDGVALDSGRSAGDGASIDFSTWVFPMPFVFPSGARCSNFMQLALACQKNPQETIDVLQKGFLGGFFGSLGRVDLAMAAAAAAKAPDPDRGVDDLLEKLPGSPLRPAVLAVEPPEVELGVIQVGEDQQFELKLSNKGDRLVHGKVSIEACPWLVVGDSEASEKLFQFFDRTSIPVRVRGKLLRAKNQPQKAEIAIESKAGNFIIEVNVNVPVKPFTEGVLAGATSPRQLAEKAKAHTKEAAVLLETGSVARWYEANGWTYPVQGPTAAGIAAVQQFFEMLGLVKPPKVELSEKTVSFYGKPGDRVEHVISVVTQEKRAAVAHATSDQPWLTIGKTTFKGQTASIPLLVEFVPNEPKQTLKASVKVVGNGNQRFDVPVTLSVVDGPYVEPPYQPSTPGAPSYPPSPIRAAVPSRPEVVPTLSFADEEVLEAVQEIAPVKPVSQPIVSLPTPVPITPAPTPAAELPAVSPADPGKPAGKANDRKELLIRLIPIGIILLGLFTAVGHDLFFGEPGGSSDTLPPIDYAHPLLEIHFHDTAGPLVDVPTMRFGLGTPDPAAPGKFKTRLIFEDNKEQVLRGQTCNVCVKVDRTIEYLWGVEQGTWRPPMLERLGKDLQGNQLIGARSTWMRTTKPPIHITQHVELVPGGLSEDGSKRLLDTCLVYYDIRNDDTIPHPVGLRFLLDTFIGTNDAVPFTIAGEKELCDTMKPFNKPEDVPDFIQALERADVKNPGTVAYLSLKYGGGLEPPNKVTLGAWPDASLRALDGGEKAQMQKTRWDVPLLDMHKAKIDAKSPGDSAVTMYWDEKEVMPGTSRRVGFAYGLGQVSGDKGDGQLGLTAGGELVAEKEFSLTAYVKNPAPGTTITLTLPKGLTLKSGTEKEPVPAVPAGASSPYSPVTWRVHAVKGGIQRVTVTLNNGATLSHRLVVKQAGEFLK